MENTEEYAKARKRAKAKYGFFVHTAVYLAVMTLLIVINLMTKPDTYWFIWPLFGWGIAVVLHAASVYMASDGTPVLDALTERELQNSNTEKRDKNA